MRKINIFLAGVIIIGVLTDNWIESIIAGGAWGYMYSYLSVDTNEKRSE